MTTSQAELQKLQCNYDSPYEFIGNYSLSETMKFYDELNNDKTHFSSSDDICTPMECVKLMLNYIPEDFWTKPTLKILDPCCGNGNFGAYCKFKTSIDNIWFNDINETRINNCKQLLNPKHISILDAKKLDKFNEWDLIMANPPYSGGGNKNRSISNIFIEHSIDLLKDGGYLCFVTPNNWMTYNNNNTTLNKLLTQGSFLVINNDIKRFFKNIGSSFTVFVWQKGVYDNKTHIINNYIHKDEQFNVEIPNNLKFLPLYISQEIINIIYKTTQSQNNNFKYRCDLHNFTQKNSLSDIQDEIFKYETIHTPKKTRYASKKQDIYNKWLIIVPLSTYYIPYIKHHVNTTQSVGYFSFNSKQEAKNYLNIITQPHFKVLIHLTRYGNFNNIMVLKHLKFDSSVDLNEQEHNKILELLKYIKY